MVTKFHYICSALTNEMSKKAKNVIKNPPVEGKYNALKAALCDMLCMTRSDRASRIITRVGMGGLRPMDLWAEMNNLVTDLTVNDLMFASFLEEMPSSVRNMLIGYRKAGQSFAEIMAEANSLVDRAESDGAINTVDRQRSAGKGSSSLCFYHRRFAKKAKKCSLPCSWCGPDARSTTNVIDGEDSFGNGPAGHT